LKHNLFAVVQVMKPNDFSSELLVSSFSAEVLSHAYFKSQPRYYQVDLVHGFLCFSIYTVMKTGY